jgi:simple sugar transport system ATP-binding protein
MSFIAKPVPTFAGHALLSLRGVSKHYGAVEALSGADLEVATGDVLGICGDNGAGKSTLIRIISGAQEPSAGEMTVRGAAVRFRSPHDAHAAGIATIYQDLALAPRLAIWKNVFLGAELTRGFKGLGLLDKARMRRDAASYMARLGITVADPDKPVENLSGGQRQAVAIARALRLNAELIVMDEPTAALGVKETAQVLDLIRRLKADGKTVILVSHNMADVVAVASRVAIFKSGRKVIDRATAGLDADALAHMVMTGGDAGA